MFTLKDPNDSKIFFKSTVKADGTGPAAKKTMSIELDMTYLARADKKAQLNKVKSYVANKTFVVKSCKDFAEAQRLMTAFGKDKLIFDDSNPSIKAFKAQLEADPDIKLASQPQHAHIRMGRGG